MPAVPLPVAALAAASHVAPSLVAPFFRRLMLNPRRHVRPPPSLPLRLADERIDLGDGLIAWRWGEGPAVLLVHGFEGNRAQFAAIIGALVERGFAAVALDVLKRELQRFAKAVGLSTRGTAAFIASVERHVGRPAADFDVRHIAGKVALPLLLIHDQDDRRVPVVEAARAAHVLVGAELMVTHGLGHNRLLADPTVVTAIVDFVAAQETTGSACTW